MSYGRFAYYYDRLMEEMPYPSWLAFAEEGWKRFGKPGTLVDLGCGTGSLTIPFAERGIQVTGIDLSEDMLAVAESKSARLTAGGAGMVRWVQQDMREWQLPEAADAVVSFCDCLNYLTEEEDVAHTFRQTWEGLKPGGVFLFDVLSPFQLQRYAAEQPFFLNEEDIAYIWTSEYEQVSSRIEHDLTIFVKESHDGTGTKARFIRIEETHIQRAYSQEKLMRMLEQAGFAEIGMYADFEWKPPAAESERIFFAARKPLGGKRRT